MIRGKGFTLIELIVVIVILAVLAVVAAPRFLDLNSDARESMLKGAAAELQQAINFAHQRWVVEGIGNVAVANMPRYAEGTDTNPNSNSIDSHLDMNDVGYPIGVDKNPQLSAPLNIGRGNKACFLLWNRLLDSSLVATDNANQIDDFDIYATRRRGEGEFSGAQTRCAFIYTRDGFSTNPNNATHVIWYDSRTGDISYVLND